MSTREPRGGSVEIIDATTIYETDVTRASDGSDTESVEMMVSDIEETRVEVTDTLGEIGERLDPGHLVDQAKENVRDATIGRVEEAVEAAGDTARGLSDMVIETIKQNPIPSAVAGVGLAWLWKNRSGGEQQAHDQRYAGGSGARYGYYGEDRSPSGGGIGRSVGDAAGNVGQTAGDIAGNVGRSAGDVAGTVGDTAGEVVERGQMMAQQAGTQLEDMLDSNPLAIGIIALGAGAAIGVLVPETRQEHQLLGGVSNKVTDTVQQKTSETMDKVEKVASKAGETAKQEAKSEGLSA